MTSENNKTEKKITIIKRVSWDGGDCPDGVDCPALIDTNWGKRLTVGRIVTDPAALRMLNLLPDDVVIETPNELWDAAMSAPIQLAADPGMRFTAGRLVTDPEVLRMLHLPLGEVAVETPEEGTP